MTTTPPANPKQAFGDLKDQLALNPHSAAIEQSKAHRLGHNKYGFMNWRENPVEAMTYAHAMIRHIYEWIEGRDTDAESGAHPFGHVMSSAAIVIDAAEQGTLIDNRPRNRKNEFIDE